MLNLVSRWIGNKPGPSMLKTTTVLDGLNPDSRKAVLEMTRGLTGQRRDSAHRVLAEFGDQGVSKFQDFGLRFSEKKLARYDTTAAFYTDGSRKLTFNKRLDWEEWAGDDTVRHELFHVMDHMEGKARNPGSLSSRMDTLALSGLTAHDGEVQDLYRQYRARGAVQYAMEYRDQGVTPDDGNVFNRKEATSITQRGKSYVVDTDPNWFSRQHGTASALIGALGVGLMAVGGIAAPVLGAATLGLGVFVGRKAMKEAVNRFVKEPVVRTVTDLDGREATVECRGDRFVVTPDPAMERRFQVWSNYAMSTNETSEYFAEAGAYVVGGGPFREAVKLSDPAMASYVTKRWESFTGLPLPQGADSAGS